MSIKVENGGYTIPVSIETLLDASWTDSEMRAWAWAEYDRSRADAKARWDALPLRTRIWRGRVLPRWRGLRWRLTHAVKALRGVECEYE